MQNAVQAASSYALGYGDEEQQRLMLQSRVIGELTRDVFARAGLAPGMRVLDVGCGVGDVSLLARSFVGERGSVVGVDRSPDSLELARRRARGAGFTNLDFVQADVSSLTLDGPFDAIVGRLILLYLPQPAQVLRHWLSLLRPGGLVVFQEMDMASARAVPFCPLYARVGGWLNAAFERAGVDTLMGSHLYASFREAGLPGPELWSGQRSAGGEQSDLYEWLVETLRSLLPLIEKFGVATREELQLESLAQRLRAEVAAGGGVIHAPCYVGAWATKR